MHLPDPDDVRPYSSWDVATHGPDPRPGWVVTELSALDTELGILKTGKEADVHLVHRGDARHAGHSARGEAVPAGRTPHVPPGRGLHRRPAGAP